MNFSFRRNRNLLKPIKSLRTILICLDFYCGRGIADRNKGGQFTDSPKNYGFIEGERMHSCKREINPKLQSLSLAYEIS